MTVSRVLAHPERVTEDTRARVNEAIEQLGYVPNRVAGSLSSKRTGFVAAILPTLNNTNFSDTAAGLTEILHAAEYQLLVGYTNYRLGEEEALVRAMLARRPEGMVIVGGHHTAGSRNLLLNSGIPVVEIWDLPSAPIERAIGFSNVAVGRALTRRLIELGYRRIAFLAPPRIEGFFDFRGEDRLVGYLEAMAEAGREELVVRQGGGPVSFTEGATCMAYLLDHHSGVDAAFAVSDMAAVGALTECQRRGIAVPEEMAIAGFGDFEIGALTVPPLTTVRVDCMGIGRRAGELIVRLIGGDEAVEPGQETVDLGFEIVERETTRRS